jgi:hypothetical protein
MAYSGMIRVRTLALAASAAALLLSGPAVGQGLSPHPIDLGRPYREADYRPIVEAIGPAPVVALGESIHLTREMPLARLNLLRLLHRERGVDALALVEALERRTVEAPRRRLDGADPKVQAMWPMIIRAA